MSKVYWIRRYTKCSYGVDYANWRIRVSPALFNAMLLYY